MNLSFPLSTTFTSNPTDSIFKLYLEINNSSTPLCHHSYLWDSSGHSLLIAVPASFLTITFFIHQMTGNVTPLLSICWYFLSVKSKDFTVVFMVSPYLFYFNSLSSSHNGLLSVSQRCHLEAFNSKLPYAQKVLLQLFPWPTSFITCKCQLKFYLFRKAFTDHPIKSMSQSSCLLSYFL